MTSIIKNGQNNFVDNQTTHADTQTTYVGQSFKMELSSEDLNLVLKLAINHGIAASLTAMSVSLTLLKIDITVFKIANHGIKLATGAAHVDFSGFHNFS